MAASITRRRFVQGMGAGATLAGLGPALVGKAQAAGGPVVVGTWGGDYQNLMDQYIAQPIMAPIGYQIVFDSGLDTARKTKLLAEHPLPRGSMDVVALTHSGSYEMWKNDTLAELDLKKMPNFSHVIDKLRTPYSVPHIYTGRVILYNPKFVKDKPTSYADLWNPAYAGKVGVIDIQYQTTIESAAMISGGTMSNYEPGKAKLLELKKAGVKIYPTNEAMASALKTEEVWMCIMWKARGVMWQNAGIPIEMANPKEGIVLYVSDQVMAKNARNKDGAYAWLNGLLEPSAQVQFARGMGYNPTVNNVDIPADLKARIDFPADVTYINQDQDYLAKNDGALKDWWDKEFKA
ncbi:MAG TPA: extracellular solute-binding protein [Aliidongia sp.]|uniref:ABC transporter substrate-binding protein n=1 Tax=Aliidongia sp. TaxID=1914230 RepID=UPI002DDD91D7|nr:extracellular solute-binding protein [Aliidongia sp.]HEV2673163.1 extracellular solute-binding protein [Aliidongia sp.]